MLIPHPDWDATPDHAWIGEPDEHGDLTLYSRLYHQAGAPRPLS